VRSLAVFSLTAACLVGGGCAANPAAEADAANRSALQLLVPSGIEIIEPFTRIANFDDDPQPDGIEIMLQAVNPLDSPCLMIVGTVRVEMYEFVPASADRMGRRIELWTIGLTDREDQGRYWNRMTQMYEFKLGVDPTKVPLAEKYVLQVTYNSPLGGHCSDEFVLEPERAALRPATP
jgi:hypothetical protein